MAKLVDGTQGALMCMVARCVHSWYVRRRTTTGGECRMPIAFVVGSDEDISLGRGKLAMTATQAAARVGVSERRLKRFVEEAQLTPYEEKLFNTWLYLADDVETLRSSRLKRY